MDVTRIVIHARKTNVLYGEKRTYTLNGVTYTYLINLSDYFESK